VASERNQAHASREIWCVAEPRTARCEGAPCQVARYAKSMPAKILANPQERSFRREGGYSEERFLHCVNRLLRRRRRRRGRVGLLRSRRRRAGGMTMLWCTPKVAQGDHAMAYVGRCTWRLTCDKRSWRNAAQGRNNPDLGLIRSHFGGADGIHGEPQKGAWHRR